MMLLVSYKDLKDYLILLCNNFGFFIKTCLRCIICYLLFVVLFVFLWLLFVWYICCLAQCVKKFPRVSCFISQSQRLSVEHLIPYLSYYRNCLFSRKAAFLNLQPFCFSFEPNNILSFIFCLSITFSAYKSLSYASFQYTSLQQPQNVFRYKKGQIMILGMYVVIRLIIGAFIA